MEEVGRSLEWSERVIDAALDAIVSIDGDGAVVAFNASAERLFGYTREEARGRPLAELVIPPDLRDAHRAGLARIESGESPRILDTRVELEACDRDGRRFPVELTVTRTATGPAEFTGFVRDLSSLRDAEAQLVARDAVARAIAEWRSPEAGLVDLLARVGGALDYAMGSLWVLDDEDRLVCRAFWTAPGVDGEDFEVATRSARLAPGEGFPGRAWEARAPVVAGDLGSLLADPKRRIAAALMGLDWGLAFPATDRGRPLAVLSFYSLEQRLVSETLRRTLGGIGEEVGRFLADRRAQLGGQPLSPREVEVLQLAAEGNTGPEIATQLFLSPDTVKKHFANIFEKLGVADRAAAVAHGFRIGLIS